MKHLGDVMDPSLREILTQWEHLGRKPWIVKPQWVPPALPGLGDIQKLIDGHWMPRMWQLLTDYQQILRRAGSFRVQQPGWLEPAWSADPLDLCSEDGVALEEGDPVTVLEFTVPDRHVASLRWFGHMLDVADQWGTVEWSITVNGKPVRTYFKFKQQRGTFVDPTRLAAPIKLKGKDVVRLIATGGATSVNAFGRLQGWLVAAGAVTQDGTASDWNVR